MKIDNEVTRALRATDTTPAAKSQGTVIPKKPEATTNPVGNGTVSISDASRSLAAGTSHTEAPFDSKKVEAIKSAISTGQFKVNPDAVAGKLIDSVGQLLATPSS